MKLFALTAALALLTLPAIAQPVDPTLAQKYAIDLPKQLAANQTAYDHNVNPLYDQSRLHSPYDQADLFFCKNGFVCPGWYGLVGGGGGGDFGTGASH